MKKTAKIFVLVLSLLLISAAAFCLTSCKTSGHVHTFGKNYLSDELYHYRECESPECLETSDKAAHDFGKWQTSKAATCIDSGEKYRECATCGYKITEEVEAHGHVIGDAWVDKMPTTQYDGEILVECAVCGEKIKKSIAAIKSVGLEFTLNDDEKSYSLSGIGTCTDEYINVPDTYEGLPVTAVSSKAFENNTYLKGITLSKNTVSIGERAFFGCEYLKNIEMPECLQSLGEYSLHKCFSLEYTSKNLANYIGSKQNPYFILYKIEDIRGISDLKINENTKFIYDEVFWLSASEFKKLTIPKSVKSVGYRVFTGAQLLSEVRYEGSLEEWLDIDFKSSFVVPYDLYIDGSLVTDIKIPQTVTKIKDYAFYNCSSLKSVIIPHEVSEAGADVFKKCTNLKTLTVGSGLVESGATDNLIEDTSIEKVIVSEGVKKIGAGAFYYCDGLTDLIVPDSLEEIEMHSLGTWSAETFNYNVYDDVYYIGSESNPYMIAMRSATYSKKSYELHEQTRIVNDRAFTTNAEEITLYGNIVYSGWLAFAELHNTNNIKINFIGTIDDWLNIKFNTSTSSPVSKGNAKVYFNGTLVTGLVIPDYITEIKDYSFYNFKSLESITFGSGIKSIGALSFMGCVSLENVVIPDSVVDLGARAFDGCDLLETVTLSSSLEKLNNRVFRGCEKLKKVVINSKIKSIGEGCFASCSVSEIRFIGSVEEWQAVEKGDDWISSSEYTVYCSDGTISGDGSVSYYGAE